MSDSVDIALVSYSLSPGLGGIPRVARLMRKSLLEMSVCFSSMKFCACHAENVRVPRTSAYSKTSLLVRQNFNLIGTEFVIYDSCQMAQLHRWSFHRNKPLLTFIHGIEVWEGAKPQWLQACRDSTYLVCNSSYTRQRAESIHGGFARADVCWLATESDEVPISRLSKTKDSPSALMVGRVDASEGYKGHREVIEAWPTVLKSVPNAVLRIVGSGSGVAVLKQRVENLGIEPSVSFLGFVAESELEQTYLNSDVFVLPSRGEGFGLVYIEAMRCGMPVIASIHDAGQEVVLDGETGFTVDLDEEDQLANRLIRLLGDRGLAKELGTAGQCRWKQNFTPTHFTKRFRTLVERMIG